MCYHLSTVITRSQSACYVKNHSSGIACELPRQGWGEKKTEERRKGMPEPPPHSPPHPPPPPPPGLGHFTLSHQFFLGTFGRGQTFPACSRSLGCSQDAMQSMHPLSSGREEGLTLIYIDTVVTATGSFPCHCYCLIKNSALYCLYWNQLW